MHSGLRTAAMTRSRSSADPDGTAETVTRRDAYAEHFVALPSGLRRQVLMQFSAYAGASGLAEPVRFERKRRF